MSWDKDSAGRRFAEEHRLPFPVGRDADGRIAGLYRVESTPHSFFIDKSGVVQHRVEGAMEESAIEREIEKLLAG
jgi:peroxiredoxin